VTKTDPTPQARVLPTFREVFDGHYDYVFSSLRRLGVSMGDLDDVVDEVFLRVHAKLDTYDPERPMRPWLFAFAFRAASDYRRLARHRGVALAPFDRDPGPSPEDVAMRRDTGRLVHAALDALSLNARAVLVMHEIDGMDMKEIAQALDIPLNTAYSRLRLARGTFEAKVRELQGEEGLHA
jgi:RNA polymerase sigma-70 factor, ECF subfamily